MIQIRIEDGLGRAKVRGRRVTPALRHATNQRVAADKRARAEGELDQRPRADVEDEWLPGEQPQRRHRALARRVGCGRGRGCIIAMRTQRGELREQRGNEALGCGRRGTEESVCNRENTSVYTFKSQDHAS